MPESEGAKSVRCIRCYSEFSAEEIKNANACPACGEFGRPCHIADDVILKINWHELRILTIWASNYARAIEKRSPDSTKGLQAIILRLEKQYPDKSPLTLEGEVRQVQEHFPEAEMTDSEGNVIVPKKRIQ